MRRLSGWSATGVGLVSVTLDIEQPSVVRAQEARNVAPVHGVWADSLSWAEEIPQLQAAGLKGGSMQNPLDLARRRCRGDASHRALHDGTTALQAPVPTRASSRHGSSSCDRALDAVLGPPLGAHVVTPRRGYTHHGIYVGRGRVVQYGGLCGWLRRGPVEEVVLSQFAQGRPIYIRPAQSRRFDQNEVVRRARSRLGENSYNLLTNNCEHFCEWCLHGEHRSYQVDEFLPYCGRFWRRVIELVAGETSPAGACAERSA